ncbi:hypothetical protein ACWDZ8_36425 [Streptomyces sp. NPDC003233]
MPTDVLKQFEHEVAAVLERDALTADPYGVASVLRLLVERESVASPAARALLRSSGIRQAWNACFAVERAGVVADWLAPWVPPSGPVLDLLAGDCRLTALLAQRIGRPVLGMDREGHYDDVLTHEWVHYRDLEEGPGAALPEADTVLLCAVLHHESDPVALRDLAAASPARRFLVVENCEDDEYGPDFHLLMDLFYNRCLNDIGSACTREHRRLDQWAQLLSPFGELVHTDELRPVPGLPFPYQLMVFDR